MNRRAMLLLAAILIILVGMAAAFLIRHRPASRWKSLLAEVKIGMSLDEAISVMGKPGAIGVIGIAVWHDDATQEHIQIHFDHDRRVTAKELQRPSLADRVFSVLSSLGFD